LSFENVSARKDDSPINMINLLWPHLADYSNSEAN